MKIAVFIKKTTFHHGFGGMETQNKVLCEGLAQNGYDVTVFSPRYELDNDETFENGVSYIFIDSIYRTLFSKSNKHNWFVKSVNVFEQKHKENPFNLIISQSSAGAGVIRNKETYEIPVISIAHGSIISELKTRFSRIQGIKSLATIIPDTVFGLHVFFGRQREFIHGSDKVICVSNHVKNALINETYAAESKFVVVNNGITVKDFPSYSENDYAREPNFIYVGRLEKEKGTDYLMEIAKDKRFSGLKIDIFGSGPEENTLRTGLKQRDLVMKMIVHGKVPYTQELQEYKPGLIFVFPTKRLEGFPMVLAEATYAGCVVIAFELGGVSDAVLQNETGVLVSPGDITTFKNELNKIVQDQELRYRLSKNAMEYGHKVMTSDKMIERYIEIIKEFNR